MQLQELERKIAEKTRELDSVQGRETEIYTRIVGYYRSLKNWNRGKKEEYRFRKTYEVESSMEHRAPAAANTAHAFAASHAQPADVTAEAFGTEARSYRYYYSPTCPNCKAMRAVLDEVTLPGQPFNVADEEGFEQASRDEIYATPCVVALDSRGNEIWRTGDPREAEARLSAVAQPV